jgi:hypothetical protein
MMRSRTLRKMLLPVTAAAGVAVATLTAGQASASTAISSGGPAAHRPAASHGARPDAASASGGWTIQSTYAPPRSKANPKAIGLSYVSCPASNACVTIGEAGVLQLLSESWNGTRWSPLRTPLPPAGGKLGGVSCWAASACMAAGFTENSSSQGVPLVERWNGMSWRRQAVSGPPGAAFLDISCPAAQFCMAVGEYNPTPSTTATLAEVWNGTHWTVQPMPQAGHHARLTSVSCPTVSDCVAVGDNSTLVSGDLVIERWNGTNWTIQRSPQVPRKDGAQFLRLSCATASSCTALGNYLPPHAALKTVVEHWDGTSWVRQHVPGAASGLLTGVSCPSATSCTAVGGTAAAHWNGTAWTLQQTAKPPHALGPYYLVGVSCPTTSVCEAVGSFRVRGKTGSFREKTLIEAN